MHWKWPPYFAIYKPGDEVIMPSFTFVSTANAFMLRGATIRFADTYGDYPNIDPVSVEKLITPKYKGNRRRSLWRDSV